MKTKLTYGGRRRGRKTRLMEAMALENWAQGKRVAVCKATHMELYVGNRIMKDGKPLRLIKPYSNGSEIRWPTTS